MPRHSKGSKPKRPSKRCRDSDDGDSVSTPPSKRHRLPSPSTPEHGIPQGLQSPGDVPTQSKPIRPVQSPRHETDRNGTSPKLRRIHEWLAGTTAANPDDHQPLSIAPFYDNPLSPLVNVTYSQLPEMSPSPPRNSGTDWAPSGQSARSPTADTSYRSTLAHNGVRIDLTGSQIPDELREFLDANIRKSRPLRLPPEDVTKTINMAVRLADSPESALQDLIRTAMFPIIQPDLCRGGNTRWSSAPLPRNDTVLKSVAAPQPDVHIGYPIDSISTWTLQEDVVISYPVAEPYTRPALGNCLPFLVLEMKSEATGGTLWHAENQLAGSGAHCVNSMRWLLREADPSPAPSILDTVAFSIAMTQRAALYYVHWYSDEQQIFYMSCIGSFSTLRAADIQASHDIVLNILEHGLGPRKAVIRRALGNLWSAHVKR